VAWEQVDSDILCLYTSPHMSFVPCKDRSGVDTDSDNRYCYQYAVPLEGGFAGVSAIGHSTILAESHMSHSEVPGGWLKAAHSLVEVDKMTLPWT